METMSNHLPNLDEEKLKFVIELKEKGISKIYRIGIAFKGENVKVKYEIK